ncbi:phytanoyl-CoA dioxygenase [Pyronema domesticum]|uniref:Similar to phytanoyl-CoA dioxygenase [Aspergillus oryzae RIB40] acc. no. XP_001827369 n=1 Tax=Pyronema omphalodes (strain CBS 100304) TaxID=1076935 RepID=U4KV52_PYROM|nr:phytanoyl-CoA dioxygenase [Pyronema domesticum]CCX05062.1 Similar to phytanoyl-CoA dioxygenase [Aspergillus oryzae RIB40]; acc. no. XP_001827369 [Pyronema omphalodes CBS 100304]
MSEAPVSIIPSPAELESKQLSPQNLEKALTALHKDGLVVLENVIPLSQLEALNKIMVADAKILSSRGDDSPFNYHKGNIQQDPPLTDDLFFPDIYLNPFAIQVTTGMYGPPPKMTFLSGNTALPHSTESQPVHTDADFDHPTIPFAYVVNVPLIPFSITNGSTEVWLGTHIEAGPHQQQSLHGARHSGAIIPELLEERRKIRGPIQPTIPAGSIVVRDLRLWHCGKPNSTVDIRVMLAMIHFAPWYRNQMKLKFPKGGEVEKRLKAAEGRLQVPCEWVEGEVNHLAVRFGNSYNFGQSD